MLLFLSIQTSGLHGMTMTNEFSIDPSWWLHCPIMQTKRDRVSEIVQFLLNKIVFQNLTINDHLIGALGDSVTLLKDKNFQSNNHSLKYNTDMKPIIQTVADILHWIKIRTSSPPPTPNPHTSNVPPLPNNPGQTNNNIDSSLPSVEPKWIEPKSSKSDPMVTHEHQHRYIPT